MVRGRTGTKLALFFKRRQKTSGKLLICLVCPPCYPRSVSHRPLTEHIPSLSPVSGFRSRPLGEKRHVGLLHAGEHFLSMCARVDLRKDVGDDAVLINDIGDAARQTGAPSPIGFAQDMVRIAQEWEAEAGIVGKGSVVFDRIKAHAEDLHVALREGVIEGEEPAPFGGSPPGAGFGIKPQDDLFATEIA